MRTHLNLPLFLLALSSLAGLACAQGAGFNYQGRWWILLQSLQASQQFRHRILFLGEISPNGDLLLAKLQNAAFGSADGGFLGLHLFGDVDESRRNIFLFGERCRHVRLDFFLGFDGQADFMLDQTKLVLLRQRRLRARCTAQ